MTLSASVEVMDARREEMPERAQSALDLLKSDVIRFQGLVEDLLEVSIPLADLPELALELAQRQRRQYGIAAGAAAAGRDPVRQQPDSRSSRPRAATDQGVPLLRRRQAGTSGLG